ncbi:MAG: glycosyltransferase family 2 protein [Solirubrobacteraceae bacterium]
MSPAAVTVAVVSWNTRELLLGCLAALHGDVEAGRADVYVIDNGSQDGSAAAARRHAPWAQVLLAPGNVGFGAAVNLVAAHTQSEWLAAANADVAVTPGALQRLLAAGSDPRAGAVAPRLALPGGDTQHSVGPLPTLPLALTFALGAHKLSPQLGDRLCLETLWDPERPRFVPWAIGAFLLLRRSAFDAIGGFDEHQWMYAEDLDLGWRLREAGWLTRYEPGALVKHAGAAATAQAFGPERTVRFMRATYEVIARRRGTARARLTAAVNLLGTLLRVAWMAPLALARPGRRPQLRATCAWAGAHRQGLRIKLERDAGGR